jgi:ornithine carbamoyltransferase
MSTTMTLPPSVLRVADLGAHGLFAALDLAAAMKERPQDWREALRGETVACYFAKPSTRTRVSFETATYRLGALPIMLRPDELQLGRGEPIADTARVLSSYCAAIVIRTFAQADVAELAAAASVPVINALTDEHHPCQALADLLTLREHFGELHRLKLAYVGDGNNVARSLAILGALAGVEVAVAAPDGYQLPDAHGAELTADPAEAVAGADAVYTDVWVSMSDAEEEAAARREALAPYRLDDALLDRAAPDAFALHCLPAHPGEEITESVLYGGRQRIWDQAENRRHAQKALLEYLVSASG